MLDMDPSLLGLAVGCLFILVFGGLGYLRREGLSVQFALEAVGVTAILVGGSALLGVPIHPLLLLALLYLITMRSRLIVDLANVLAGRGNFDLAFRLYKLGLAMWPDEASRLIVLSNRGAAQLRSGQVDGAIATLESVLEVEKRPRLGIKYEAACRYNLGYAYEKTEKDAQAVAQYNEAVDLLPGSVYGKAAAAALKRRKGKDSSG
ncbi:MAG: tetratricopeptide repeat protein [Anaerolineae bacterium]|jgi:tetratricopeptide (TPR) repeat protein